MIEDFILFGLLFHKKVYSILFTWSITLLFGLGRDENKWLNAEIMKVFITVIFPIGDIDLLPHILAMFSRCFILDK